MNLSEIIPIHTGLAAEHIRQALDYRQASDGDALSAMFEAESFRAAHRASEAETIPPVATAALCVIAWVLIGMLAYAVAVAVILSEL